MSTSDKFNRLDLDEAVFEFNCPVEFIQDYQKRRKGVQKNWNLLTLSKSLGYTNSSMLSAVLNRKRKFTPELCERVGRVVFKSDQAKTYFREICLEEKKSESFIPKALLAPKRGQTLKSKLTPIVNPDQKNLSWIHFLLLDFCDPVVRKDPVRELPERSSFKVDSQKVEAALRELLEWGWLEHVTGGFRKSNKGMIYRGLPSESIRRCQEQLMQLGIESIKKHSPNVRETGTRSIWASEDKIAQAKKMIENFRFELAQFLEESDVSSGSRLKTLYQFNVQFFPLLSSPEVDKIRSFMDSESSI